MKMIFEPEPIALEKTPLRSVYLKANARRFNQFPIGDSAGVGVLGGVGVTSSRPYSE